MEHFNMYFVMSGELASFFVMFLIVFAIRSECRDRNDGGMLVCDWFFCGGCLCFMYTVLSVVSQGLPLAFERKSGLLSMRLHVTLMASPLVLFGLFGLGVFALRHVGMRRTVAEIAICDEVYGNGRVGCARPWSWSLLEACGELRRGRIPKRMWVTMQRMLDVSMLLHVVSFWFLFEK